MSRVKNVKWFVLILLAIAVFAVWYAVFKESRAVLTVAFLDVGQGDATFIQSPSGRQVLIDGGSGRAVLRELGRVMPFYDRSIDIILATHPDRDHIGGLPEVLERFKVERVIEPGLASDTGVYKAFTESTSSEGASHVLARRGQVIDLGSGAYLRILFPDRDVTGFESNTASVITQLVYGDTEFILTGDAPRTIEQYVALLEKKFLESDVLKIGHHGSRTSSATVFVGWVDPEYGIISAGCGNRYGHPHQEVLDTFAKFEIETFSTCDEGTIVFTSDGNTLRIKK